MENISRKIGFLVVGLLSIAVLAQSYTHLAPLASQDLTQLATQVRYHSQQGFWFGSFAFSQRPAPTVSVPTGSAQTTVANASPAVVYVNGYKDVPTYTFQYGSINGQVYANQTQSGTSLEQATSGSGFFITSNGYILTNKHVVSDTSATYKVNYNGKDIPAQVVYRDPDKDLAIVKIDGSNFPTIQLGDSSSITPGQTVVAIGNALGRLTDFATQGTITALSQNIVVSGKNGSSETLNGVIQTSARLYPGDSGGPLLNLNGQAIAVNTATATSGRLSAGFSIPVNSAKDTIAKAGLAI